MKVSMSAVERYWGS